MGVCGDWKAASPPKKPHVDPSQSRRILSPLAGGLTPQRVLGGLTSRAHCTAGGQQPNNITQCYTVAEVNIPPVPSRQAELRGEKRTGFRPERQCDWNPYRQWNYRQGPSPPRPSAEGGGGTPTSLCSLRIKGRHSCQSPAQFPAPRSPGRGGGGGKVFNVGKSNPESQPAG